MRSVSWARVLVGCGFLLATAGPAMGAAISQGYKAKGTLVPGTLVSLVKDSKDHVEAANPNNSDNLLGVVVPASGATVEINESSSTVQVATSGAAVVFVSDLGGQVKAGDHIGVSPISGIGQKVTEAGRVVGVAQSDAPAGGQATEVSTQGGAKVTAHIVSIPVTIQANYYAPGTKGSSLVPSALQQFADSVAGHPVALARLLASAVILVTGLLVAGVILFAAVRSTLISLGRNPLARRSIYRGLWQVVVTGFVLIFVSFVGSYAALTV